MNPLLQLLAKILASEICKKTLGAQETRPLNDAEKTILATFVQNYTDLDQNAVRAMANIMAVMDPNFKPIYTEFLKKIGATSNGIKYEALTMLTSIYEGNHAIVRDEPFLVFDAKGKKALKINGENIPFDDRERSSRLATEEEINTYLSKLTSKHMIQFSANEAFAKFTEQAMNELVPAASATPKIAKSKKNAIAPTPVIA